MKNLFLDPQKPLSTCTSASCQGCPLQNRLQCHFEGKNLARFLLIAFPPFILGGDRDCPNERPDAHSLGTIEFELLWPG
jgi:hypothetical protein